MEGSHLLDPKSMAKFTQSNFHITMKTTCLLFIRNSLGETSFKKEDRLLWGKLDVSGWGLFKGKGLDVCVYVCVCVCV